MEMTVAVDVSNESAILDVVEVDIPEVAGLGRWRTFALIAFSALSAGGFFTLMKTLAEPKPGSAAEATEQLLRAEEPSAIAVAIVIVLIVTVVGAAAAMALRRHAD